MKGAHADAAQIIAYLQRNTLGKRLRDVRDATKAALAMLRRQGLLSPIHRGGDRG